MIPGEEKGLETLLKMANIAGAKFVNLNELEYSPTNHTAFSKLGFTPIDDFTTAVRGSSDLALKLLEHGQNVHFCSAPFKDSVQLRNRLVRRGENMARPYEVLTKDGTLIFGEVDLEGADKEVIRSVLTKHDVPEDLYEFKEAILLIAPWVLEELFKQIGSPAFEVEVYASYDSLEVERRPLS